MVGVICLSPTIPFAHECGATMGLKRESEKMRMLPKGNLGEAILIFYGCVSRRIIYVFLH